MMGGRVLEVCDTPTSSSELYVEVGQRVGDRLERCGVLVEKNIYSLTIELGDYVWWQAGTVFWTPQANAKCKHNLKAGKDYDIAIIKIGYSGVKYPYYSEI